MRFSKFTLLMALAALLLFTLPALADSVLVLTQPTQTVNGVPYGGSPAGCGPPTCATTDYGGGDGSQTDISSLGPFGFSSPLNQRNVPDSWATWGSPPATESSTPNVLFSNGATSLTLTLTDQENVVGFELEPDLFQVDNFRITFHTSTGDQNTLIYDINGDAGAILVAEFDTTPGATFTSIDIVDTSGDDFAIAQLRSGRAGTTPEPGTLVLLGSGLLGAVGVMRRKINL